MKEAVAINPYVTILLSIVIALLQSVAMPHIRIMGVKPDFMLLVVVSWSLLCGIREGSLWGFIGGLSLDIFSSAPFGVSTLALLAVGSLSSLGGMSIFRTHIVLPPITALFATSVYYLIFLALLQMMGWPVPWAESLLKVVLPSVLLNAALMPLVYGAVRWLYHKLTREGIRLAG